MCNLKGRGDQGFELSELLPKFLNAIILDPEEKECFGLLRKTPPMKNEFE